MAKNRYSFEDTGVMVGDRIFIEKRVGTFGVTQEIAARTMGTKEEMAELVRLANLGYAAEQNGKQPAITAAQREALNAGLESGLNLAHRESEEGAVDEIGSALATLVVIPSTEE